MCVGVMSNVCSLSLLQSYRSHIAGHGPHAKKDKPVSKEDFSAMVCERLTAVQKDRDHMRKRAQETARQQGKSYDEIMVRSLTLKHQHTCSSEL